MMSVAVRRLLLLVFIVIPATLGTVRCSGEAPDKEIEQAQQAIDAARAGDAGQYASDELNAAIDALKRSHDAVDQRDYRLALDLAIDSRERAQTAAKEAADAKAASRAEADRSMAALTKDLTTARAALKSAEAAHATTRTLNASRKAIADAEKRVQEARAAYDKADFKTAAAVASTGRGDLAPFLRGGEPAAAARGRRGR